MKDVIEKKKVASFTIEQVERFVVALAGKMACNMEGGVIIGKSSERQTTKYSVYDRVPEHVIGLGQIVPNGECIEAQLMFPGSYRRSMLIEVSGSRIELGFANEVFEMLDPRLREVYEPLLREHKLPVGYVLDLLKQKKR